MGQALILLVPLYRSGFRWRFRLGLHGIGLRSIGKVGGWTFGVVILDQVGAWFSTRLVSGAPAAALTDLFGPYLGDTTREGLVTGIVASAPGAFTVAGPAAYSQALMIYLLPHSLVTVSIATALFTGMSKSAAAGDIDRVRFDLSRGLRIITVFTLFAAAVLVVLALPVTKLLLPTSGASSAAAVAEILVPLAIGLVPLGGMVLMRWVYFAFEDGKGVFMIQLVQTPLFMAGCWVAVTVLPGQWWAVGIAVAFTFARIVVVVLRASGLRRMLHGIDGARIAGLLVRASLATGASVVTGFAVRLLFGDLYGLSWMTALVVTVVVTAVMGVTYVAVLRLLRVQELTDVLRPFAARLRPLTSRIRRR
ncbi:hypothetical protein GCM10025865_13510 [Paraoerskovia sediminicola]|uniref:Peptidoglycan lipid II flippase n=1 Tax=Paraoerskovia sediminicola TaxID=1138587 RepID=A0ABN6XAS8_9CELL|nr:lipid II flippase MurJ [Paraoerskovia sediminicola]BDZ42052.1 hypothetical protein GCM10025865_13510 [Paraoerskovia sediminicola]